MKVKLFTVVTTICAVLMFSSCENNNDDNRTEILSKKLSAELKEFNQNYQYQPGQIYTERRSWWNTIGQVCAIALGDGSGAAAGVAGVQLVAGVVGAATAGTGYAVVATIGGIVGGIGGSYGAYCGTGGNCRQGNFNTVNPTGTSVVYNLPNGFEYINNFGELHNNGLQNIHFLGDASITELEWISNNINNLESTDYKKLYNSSEFKNLITDIKTVNYNYKNNNYDVKLLLSDYKSKGLMNETVSSVFSNYSDAISKAEGFNDVRDITDFYVTKISESSLNTKDKEAILAGLAVSIQSFYFWLNFEIE
ncbi:hypothetical protein [Flavobacterium sp. '19STA2R22 D10 B1']|uniref:hypothetical protein n=1 Tax=Flavobacterium aerium TaxID=3037261 RepID=UPI00278C13DA|nr:hypothetical protein [Flavobacterium sp. '19STA2R22 D10 B1']